MEPRTPAARLRWLEHNIEGLAHEITSIRAQLRALVMRPPTIDGDDEALAELLQRQLETMEAQCALVRAHLSHLRADLTDEPTAATSTAADTMDEPGDRGASEEPGEP